MYFLTFVLKNLLRRKVRSGLTIVGVAMAVAAVVALVGTSNSFERAFAELYDRRGVDLVVFRTGVLERLTSNIDQNVGARIEALPGVRAVSPALVDVVAFEKANVIGAVLQGWPPDSILLPELEFTSGRRIQAGDRGKTILGSILAKQLNKGVGEQVELEGEMFEVIGVFKSFNVYENGSAVILLEELQRLMDRPRQVTGFMILLEPAADKKARIEEVRTRIEAMQDAKGRSLALQALTISEHVGSTIEIQAAHATAWVTSVIALVIGTIGVLNTMMMSVFERTREIGVLRALGWRRGRVVSMILWEALFLSLAGAIAGSVAGIVLARVVTLFPWASGLVEGGVSPAVIIQGFVIALVVGVAGGAYPAFRATRLLPTEALRHE